TVKSNPFHKGFHHPQNCVPVAVDIGFGRGKTTRGIVKPQFGHVDKLVHAQLFHLDVLRRDERRGINEPSAQSDNPLRRGTDENKGNIPVRIQSSLLEQVAQDSVFQRSQPSTPMFFRFRSPTVLILGVEKRRQKSVLMAQDTSTVSAPAMADDTTAA